MARKKRRRRDTGDGTICRDSRSGIYQLRHPALGGSRSLGTRDEGEAHRKATELFGDLILAWKQGKVAKAVLSRHREAAGELARIEAERNAKKTPLAGCWDTYLHGLPTSGAESRHVDATDEIPLSPRTVADYKRQFAAFVKGMAERDAATVEDLDAEKAKDYFRELKLRRSASTYNRHRTAVYVVLAGALDDETASQILAGVKRAKNKPAPIMRPLTADEVKAARSAPGSAWLKAAFDIGLVTGLRLGDVITLRREDIDIPGCFLFHRARKTGKEQAYYVPEVMRSIQLWSAEWMAVNEVNQAGEYLFPDQAASYLGLGDRKPDPTVVSRAFSNWLRETLKPDDPERIGFASLRKTAATVKAAKTGDRVAAAQLLGHSSTAVTDQHYIKPTREQQKQIALAQANPLANFTDAEIMAEVKRRNLDV